MSCCQTSSEAATPHAFTSLHTCPLPSLRTFQATVRATPLPAGRCCLRCCSLTQRTPRTMLPPTRRSWTACCRGCRTRRPESRSTRLPARLPLTLPNSLSYPLTTPHTTAYTPFTLPLLPLSSSGRRPRLGARLRRRPLPRAPHTPREC
eukprot:6087326-Prymnesium_polylepis.1